MAFIYLSWDDFVQRAGTEVRLKQLAPGDTEDEPTKTMAAENAAVLEMHSYLRKRGYKLPLDKPLPEDVKQQLLSLAMQYLTLRSEGDPYGGPARQAREYFLNISIGRATLGEDLDPSTAGGTKDQDILFSRQPRVFDFDDGESEGGSRMPPL